MNTEKNAEVEIRPAATVALLRGRAAGMEILLLRRQSKLAFAPGMWVFPGGRIDPEDYDSASDDILAAARRAAVREAMEEAAVAVDPEALVYFAHWTTPNDGSLRRFATWFFVAGLDGEHAVQVDGGEIDDHQWLRPADAIAAHRRREMGLMPPTYATLKEVAACNSIAEVLTLYRTRPVIEIEPRHLRAPKFVAVYPGDVAYEGGDPHVPGPRHRSWSTDDGLEYERDPDI